MSARGLGRVEHFDVRNLNYLIADVVATPFDQVRQAVAAVRGGPAASLAASVVGDRSDHVYYYDSAWWGDQNGWNACTAYAAMHAMADGPVTHPGQVPLMEPLALYREIQAEDRRNGRDYGEDGGATSLAMAMMLKQKGWIGEFRWGYSLADFLAAIKTGPVLLGIDWPEGMDTPDRQGIARWRGTVRGGHEIVSNGLDLKNGFARLKQSWGRTNYGRNGHAYLPLEDVEKAIAAQGDVLLFRELKTDDPRTPRDESKAV